MQIKLFALIDLQTPDAGVVPVAVEQCYTKKQVRPIRAS